MSETDHDGRHPAHVWRVLASKLAARRSMRLVDSSGKFGSTRALSRTVPAVPAAVPIYARTRRTHLLAFDFDAKGHSSAAVDADVVRLTAWLDECGGRWITDRSTSGGRHVLVPLASGAAIAVEQIAPLMRLLAARLQTLDITPMLNPGTGCITPPGAACREGGHRILLGSLADALDALTVRSAPGLVARLVATLGGGTTPPDPTNSRAGAASAARSAIDLDERTTGTGDHQRLSATYQRRTPLPAPVAQYAATGHLDSSRWRSHSEARQSVLTHAVLRGASASDVRAALLGPDWAGVRTAYTRYSNAGAALDRDVARALRWAAANTDEFRNTSHEYKHTGGFTDGSLKNDSVRRRWLAHALLWADDEFVGKKGRPQVAAVLQALAYASGVAGEIIEGVPVVAMGGRGLSHAAGLMSERSVFSVLAEIREMEGSPVLLVARGAGEIADRYALTTPAAPEPTDIQVEAVRVEPVHPAWSVLGLRCRRLYEEVQRRGTGEVSAPSSQVSRTGRGEQGAGGTGECTAAELFAAARAGSSRGYDILADLIVAGMIVKTSPGTFGVGPRSLDDVAAAAGVARIRRERIVRHRAERVVWRAWLEQRFAATVVDTSHTVPDAHWIPTAPHTATDPGTTSDEDYWASLLATGPPDPDGPADDFGTTAAMAVLADLLGARLLP